MYFFFVLTDSQAATYICAEHRRALVMDRVISCVMCGKDRSLMPRGHSFKAKGIAAQSMLMTITYG